MYIHSSSTFLRAISTIWCLKRYVQVFLIWWNIYDNERGLSNYFNEKTVKTIFPPCNFFSFYLISASLSAEFPTLQRSWNLNAMGLLEEYSLHLLVHHIFFKKREILFGSKYLSFHTPKTVVSGHVHMEETPLHL